MRPTYFVDAWFFIGALDRRDAHHERITRLQTRLAHAPMVTHTAIFHEVLAYFAEDGWMARERAMQMIRRLLIRADVITPDRSLFLRALDRYAARPDKEYSLTDCLSMVIMEERGIREVLTNDHHFSQAGFVVVSE
jgi:predicted nucleic acid-binding protein